MRGLVTKLVGGLIAVVLAGGGAVYASGPSQPDSPLYGIKRATERVQLALAGPGAGRAELALTLAERRVAEAAEMARRGKPQAAAVAARGYEEAMEEVQRGLEEEGDQGKDVEALVARFLEHLERQQGVLRQVQEQVPEEAREAIGHALEVSRRGQQRAQEAVSKEGPGKSEETPGKPAGTPGGKPKTPGKPETPGKPDPDVRELHSRTEAPGKPTGTPTHKP